MILAAIAPWGKFSCKTDQICLGMALGTAAPWMPAWTDDRVSYFLAEDNGEIVEPMLVEPEVREVVQNMLRPRAVNCSVELMVAYLSQKFA